MRQAQEKKTRVFIATKESIAREIAKAEKRITAREEELDALRALRFEPEYYQDYARMNSLEEDIARVQEELGQLEEKWEELLAQME